MLGTCSPRPTELTVVGVTDVHWGKSKDTKVTWEYVMKGMLSVLRMEMRAGEELLGRTVDIPE